MGYEVILTGTREIQGVKCLLTNSIEFLPITHNLLGINALVFTSSYAIHSLAKSSESSPHLSAWKHIPSFVISPKSEEVLKGYGACVEFVGKSGEGRAFGEEICPLLKGRNVLYLRAKKIVSGLDSIFKAYGISFEQVFAYENIYQKLPSSLKPKPHSIIIFPSPSAYHSFVENFGWDSHYKALALGRTTFSHFDKHICAILSPHASFGASIAFAKELSCREELK